MPGRTKPLNTWKVTGLLYVILLLISFLVQNLNEDEQVSSDYFIEELQIASEGTNYRLPYRNYNSKQKGNHKSILLLDISDGNIIDRELLSRSLSDSFRVIIPEFEALKTNDGNPQYLSFIKLARLSKQLLNQLRVDSIHVVGIEYGSLVGLYFTDLYPGHSNSVNYISPKGIQELDFLGGYHLNNGVYTAQLSFIYAIKYGIPHFGLFNRNEKIAYLRILLASDQRKSTQAFRSFKLPMQLHYCGGPKSRTAFISEEIHRIVPQSELLEYTCQNELSADTISRDITRFINSTPKEAEISSNARIARSLLPFQPKMSYRIQGLSLLIVMILIVFSTFVSEDLTCIGAGLMVARGLIGFWPAVIACLIGIFIGDNLVYALGRWLGTAVLEKKPIKWFISRAELERSKYWFEAKGPVIIILSRFIPGSRFPTYLSAGMIKASYIMFIFYFGLASILWTPVLVGAAVIAGNNLIYYFMMYQDYAIPVLLASVFLLWGLFTFILPLLTYRGRKKLSGKLNRWKNWEFWPPYLLYLPVSIYIMWLWLRFKKITLCAAANPAFPNGGFAGESKADILKQIKAESHVATFKKISAGTDDPRNEVLMFMEQTGLQFPVVLKPDKGERGRKVMIVRSLDELRQTVKDYREDFIVQEYAGGKEFGVFYYRFPETGRGRIFSITEKRHIYLKGDGLHTLEYLILKDKRAACLADIHFENHMDELYSIPEEGEVIQLTEIGTHSRGSVFLDGSEYITSELEDKIDSISKSLEGFFFGRFDLKVPDIQNLKRGQNLKVIELNGITSEATHIYDPSFTYWKAVKTLCRQWKICYEIGLQNYRKGAELPSISEMLSGLRRY